MEGPQFSTQAESYLYRAWGMDVIGMTNFQEAKLAREAEISLATLAMITDYDCWKHDEEPVSADSVIAHLHANVASAKEILALAIPKVPLEPCWPEHHSLDSALITPKNLWPEKTVKKLGMILERFVR